MIRLRSGWRGLVNWLRAGQDFLYPPACVLCRRELCAWPAGAAGEETATAATPASPATSAPDLTWSPFATPPSAPRLERATGMCADCRTAMLTTRGPACHRCGGSIGPNLDPEQPCGYCRDEGYRFERVFRLGVYAEGLSRGCRRAKRGDGEAVAAGLTELLWSCETDGLRGAEIDLVVPVPLFWRQRLVRAHHAAQTVGEVLSRRLKVPLDSHILTKIRWTPQQTSLTPALRRTNVRRAFAVDAHADLSGATVLVADDVLTTGSTANEVAKVLLQAKAAKVLVAVLARGLGHGA